MTLYRRLLTRALYAAVFLMPAYSYAAELRPGVVVDVDRGRLYLMSPNRTIEAVDLGNGGVLWTSNQAARPLVLGNGLLTAQSEEAPSPNTLGLVVLDAERGRSVAKNSVALPPNVRASIDDRLSSKFVASAVTVGENSFVSWEHREAPVRGIPPGTDDADPRERAPAAALVRRETSGVVRLNLRSGEVSAMAPGDMPPGAREARRAFTAALAVSEDPSQRRSIDGRHVLRSERIADDRVWDKYRWTIIERATGGKVGELRSHLSQSAFIVVKNRIIFDTGPFARRTDAGIVQQPPMVRAVDLGSGKEVWSRPIRDTAYRGTSPP